MIATWSFTGRADPMDGCLTTELLCGCERIQRPGHIHIKWCKAHALDSEYLALRNDYEETEARIAAHFGIGADGKPTKNFQDLL
jgi:hypothetical protein